MVHVRAGARVIGVDDATAQATTEAKEVHTFQFRVTWTTGHINLDKRTEVGFDADGNLFSVRGDQWMLIQPRPDRAWSSSRRRQQMGMLPFARHRQIRRRQSDPVAQPPPPSLPPPVPVYDGADPCDPGSDIAQLLFTGHDLVSNAWFT